MSGKFERGQAFTEMAMIILVVVLVVAVAMFFLGPQLAEFIQPIVDSMQIK
jgi:predicted PurR-regulated permease PerM